ncbi:hypothetical protein MKZ38_000997 [Zalerion maritima]|uniref:EDC4-like protein pdc1 beta-propeller domain-containing protein n=1 Tax=Zalerion maritima TaxID=339359 RepID=A0AAD5WTK9_9PEZI|nr:hypothetical protein MKZ38_000997 [Zalerion maritima]
MSNYSYSNSEQNRGAMENMLLQQLRGQSQSNQTEEGQHPQHQPAHGQHSQYQHQQAYNPNRYDGPPNHGAPGVPSAPASNQEYDEDDDIMPPAPTPPVNNMPPGVLAYMSNSGGNSIGAPRAPPNSEHTNNLLNLLKFQGPSASQEQHGQRGLMSSSTYSPRIVAPAPVGQDPTGLLAAMMTGVHDEGQKDTPPPSYAAKANPPPEDTQAYLLGLLNRPKQSQGDQSSQQFTADSTKSSKSITLTPQSTNDSNMEYNREHHQQYQPHQHAYQNTSPTYSRHSDGYSHQHLPPALEQVQHPAPESGPVPHYQNMASHAGYHNNNPFTDITRSSPVDKTPKSLSTTPAAPGSSHSHQSPVQTLKKPSVTSSPRSAVADPRLSGSERSYVPSPVQARRGEPVPEVEEPTEEIESAAASEPDPVEEEVVEPAELIEDTEDLDEFAAENTGTVAEAVSELAPKLDREVQEALAHLVEEDQAEGDSAAEEVRSQPDMPEEEEVLEEGAREDPPMEDAVEEPVNGTSSREPVVDSWETADAEGENDDAMLPDDNDPGIPVYNFPMRPWIGLRLIENKDIERPAFREDSISPITRLKKDFDQIDRNLVTASESHIIYGMSRNGGLRVISQDDGRDAKLFTDTQDRIFNVSVSVSPASEPPVKEAIIGTGISGTVYWTLIKDGDEDHIVDAHPEQYGFALPPINSQEGDAPGGVLKTRARPSSMHPEYFAIGRGKTIHVIWPSLIMEGNLFKPGHDRTVDVEKLMGSCSLKINTGKAGKDFTFSADDTTIVTLDKAGKVKFWDIRPLTTSRAESTGQSSLPLHDDLELKEPILSLNTTSDGEKPWPTSVLLVDKPKPYQRRTAQRYMIVGTKQNHSFQLWDLTLRKVVQEINLPHGKDSDAACSLMYHSSTGMIIIGHPTRNSVYFLHLSAPKYNLKISQVDYMTRLATPDSYVPMPDCTAVLSGYREISFSASGTLRSLDLLPTPLATEEPEEPVLFELYAMHSKGVACVNVRQRDLGWSAENRVVNPKDAVECGAVVISKISSPPQVPTPGEAVAAAEAATPQIPIRVIQRRDLDEAPMATTSTARGRPAPLEVVLPVKPQLVEPTSSITPSSQATEKPEKPKNKRKKGLAGEEKSNNKEARPGNKEPKNSSASSHSASTSTIEQVEAYTNRMETRLNGQITDLGQQLHAFADRVDLSLDARDRAFDNRSRDILKTISQQLNENTQGLLTELVQTHFDQRLVPAISERATAAINSHLSSINAQVSESVKKEVAGAVPYAVSQALQDPDTGKAIARSVSNAISSQIADHVQNELSSRIFPAFKNMADLAVQQAQREFDQKLAQTTERLEYTVRSESAKADHLVGMVENLQETVKTMANTQSQFQDEILKLQQRQMASPQAAAVPVAPYQNQVAPRPALDPALEGDIREINSLMRTPEGYENALVRWLQSDFQNEVFDHYYWNVNPGFLTQVAPLVQLSVAATLTEHISRGRLRERVAWLETLIRSFHENLGPNLDNQTRDITPKIMTLVVSRIEGIFFEITRQAPQDPILKVLSGLIATGNRIVRTTKGGPTSPAHSDQRQMQYQEPSQAQYEQHAQYQHDVPQHQQVQYQHQGPQGPQQWY